MKILGIMSAAGIALAAFCFGGCGDDVTAPIPNTPINSLTLTKFGSDSLRVRFGTTISYSRATLSVDPYNLPVTEIDEILGMRPQEFRFRWTDWFCVEPDSCLYGYVSVKIFYGPQEADQYTWFRRFNP